MRDYLCLGSAPVEEDCVQVTNKEDYISAMRQECCRYKALLEQLFSNIPEDCYFSIKSFPHDFGTYYEVVIYFDNENEEQINYAYNVEENLPLRWLE